MSPASPLTDRTDDGSEPAAQVSPRSRPISVPFPSRFEGLANLLDRDGVAVLIENFLAPGDADTLYGELIEILAWERRSVTIYGKTHEMPRDTAWYGAMAYRYPGVTHPPAPWPEPLARLRIQLSDALETDFNCVLANRYAAADHLGYHADSEALFGERPTIASVSLGATRRFLMRHRDGGAARSVDLTHGSLLVMAGEMQRHWRHAVPSMSRVVGSRINLTYRRAVGSDQEANRLAGR